MGSDTTSVGAGLIVGTASVDSGIQFEAAGTAIKEIITTKIGIETYLLFRKSVKIEWLGGLGTRRRPRFSSLLPMSSTLN